MKIEINSRDLEIKTIDTGKFEGQKIVQFKPVVAFDEDFIAEMEAAGVRPKIIKEEEEED